MVSGSPRRVLRPSWIRVLQIEEQPGVLAGVVVVHQDRAALQQVAVALENEVDGGVEERVARADQLGARLLVHPVLLEADALVAREDRAPDADQAVALADGRRDVGDLVAARLAPVDRAAETREGLEEERLDVVRLEPAGVGALHVLADRCDPRRVHRVVDQGALVEQLLEVLAVDRAVDGLVEPRLDLGSLAVADGLDQQVAQRLLVE